MQKLALVAWLTGPLLSCVDPPAVHDKDSVGEALVSVERSPDLRAEDDLYAPLLGVWEVNTLDRKPDGTLVKGHGEWLFARALEGRAFQDVWIMPSRRRDGSRAAHPASRYGTTIRMMDPATHRWQIAWFNPVTGAFNLLYAHREGAMIVQEGKQPNGRRARWVFDRIGKDSFHWYGETEEPNGAWLRQVEFSGTRRGDSKP
jgi:hypothetical protein